MNFKIGNRIVSDKKPPLVILEISANHQNSKKKIFALIDKAKEIGAEAIKFQTFNLDDMTLNSNSKEFLIKKNFKNESWNNRSLYSLNKEAQFPFEWHKEVFKYAKKKKLICFSSVFDNYSLNFLEDLDTVAYKVASLESHHFPLLMNICKTKKPIIVSTGTLSNTEINELVIFLKKYANDNFALLHCVTEYPAKNKNLNLKTIMHLKNKYNCTVGFSDHTESIGAAISSVAFGANIIEKHFRLKDQKKSLDSSFSSDPQSMSTLIKETKNAWLSIGKIKTKIVKAEKIYKKFSRSIYAIEDIKKGKKISEKNIRVVRPGYGILPKYFNKLIGQSSPINIQKNSAIKKNILKKLKII